MVRIRELAKEIAKQPGKILRMAKRLLYLAQGKRLEDTLELSAAFQALCHYSSEHEQALEAFFLRQKYAKK